MRYLRSTTARALLSILAILALAISLPFILRAVAPEWWQSKQVYQYEEGQVADASDYAAANQGQLKHMAVAAYEHFIEKLASFPDGIGAMTPPPDPNSPESPTNRAGTGWRLRALVSQWIVIDPASGLPLRQEMDGAGAPVVPVAYSVTGTGPRQIAPAAGTHNDYAAINQGQIKAVAAPFYERLNEIYLPFGGIPAEWKPWTDATEDDSSHAMASLGQLKNVFSFDLDRDTDGDGWSDLYELTHPYTGNPNLPGVNPNPFDPDSDGDGIADGQETGSNPYLADTDGDGFKDGEDRWPQDGRRGDYIPPKFYAVTDLSEYLPAGHPAKDLEPTSITIDDDHNVTWVAKDEAVVSTTEDTTTNGFSGVVTNTALGPTHHLIHWAAETGTISERALIDRYNVEMTIDEFGRVETEVDILSRGIIGAIKLGNAPIGPFGSLERDKSLSYHVPMDYYRGASVSRGLVWTGSDEDGPALPQSLSLHTTLSGAPPEVLADFQYYYPSSGQGAWDHMTGYLYGNNLVLAAAVNVHSRKGKFAGTLSFVASVPSAEDPAIMEDVQRWRAFRNAPGSTSAAASTSTWLPEEFRRDELKPTFSKMSDNGAVLIGYEGDVKDADPEAEPDATVHVRIPRHILWYPNPTNPIGAALVADIGTDLDAIAVNDQRQIVALSETETDEYGHPKAYFVEVSEAGAVAIRMPLVDLLKWDNKPVGVKDDFDRFIKRLGSAEDPTGAPQVRKVHPLFISNADISTVGSEIGGSSFETGAPRHIAFSAEIAQKPELGQTDTEAFEPRLCMMDFVTPVSDEVTESVSTRPMWHFTLREIMFPPEWDGAALDARVTVMNNAGFFAGFGAVGQGDAEGEKPMLMTEGGLLVDRNHNGRLAVPTVDSVENGNDHATAGKPMTFWKNNDHDSGGTVDGEDFEEDDNPGNEDSRDKYILWRRDLEDFARLWLSFRGNEQAVKSNTNYVVLKAKSVKDEDGNPLPQPKIRIFKAAEPDGGIKYLFDNDTAWEQLGKNEGLDPSQPIPNQPVLVFLAFPFGAGVIPLAAPPNPANEYPKKPLGYAVGAHQLLPADDFIQNTEGFVGQGWALRLPNIPQYPDIDIAGGISAANPVAHLLFEGVESGEADFYFEVRYAGSGEVKTTSASIRIVIKGVIQMYERWTVGDDPDLSPASAATISQRVPAGEQPFLYERPQLNEERCYIMYVHGWNMKVEEKMTFSATAFKRLYWQGYQGRFGVFQWPTTYGFGEVLGFAGENPITNSMATLLDAGGDHSNYDRGEFRAWQSAAALNSWLHWRGLYYPINDEEKTGIHVIAHSMGNIVAGESLRLEIPRGTQVLARGYIASQAALPTYCYDSGYPRNLGAALPAILGGADPSLIDSYPESWDHIYPDWFTPNAVAVGRQVNFFNVNDYALWHDAWELNQYLKPDLENGAKQPWKYSVNMELTPALIRVNHWYKQHYISNGTASLDPGTFARPKDRYEIMAFAAEAQSKALGAALSGRYINDGKVRFTKFDDATDIQTLWTAAGANGSGPKEKQGFPFSSHKWHSAQFRSTNMFQHKYWEAVLGERGFDIIDPEDIPRFAP